MISIVIVNYNTRQYLQSCLTSIYRTNPGVAFEIIVIDNNSSDTSVEMVKRNFPQVKLIINDRNSGFAVALNKGIKSAKGVYILILNPDTIVNEGAIDELVSFMNNHRDAGITGGRVLNPDRTLQLTCRSFPDLPLLFFGRESPLTSLFPDNRFSKKYLMRDSYNKITEVDAVAGAFMIIRRELFHRCGGFDESFFLYVEDTDFCYRAKQFGYRVYYNPNASIIHYLGRSRAGKREGVILNHYRGMYKFFKKHYNIGLGKKLLLFLFSITGTLFSIFFH